MPNAKQSAAKRLNMTERAEKMLKTHFPDVSRDLIWRRKRNDGYSTVPRPLPIAMQAIDAASKGKPAGHTLFGLWARAPDSPLLVIESQAIFAAEAGFAGKRAVDTWRKRMKILRDLHFIRTKPGTAGDYHYVLLMNPNIAVKIMYDDKKVQEDLWQRFEERLNDVGGSQDLLDYSDYLDDLTEAASKAADNQKGAAGSTKSAPSKSASATAKTAAKKGGAKS